MPKHLLADTHYGSTKCIAQAKDRGVTLLAPSMPPKGKGQGKLTLEDFEVDASGHIQRCPAGHAPLSGRMNRRFEARTTRGYRWLSPLILRLFADPSSIVRSSISEKSRSSIRTSTCAVKPRSHSHQLGQFMYTPHLSTPTVTIRRWTIRRRG